MKKTGVIIARLQPIHNGHLALIEKAMRENDEVFVFVGSADKFNERNPIPVKFRIEMAKKACESLICKYSNCDFSIIPLNDLTDESDNSHDWGFYLYSSIVSESGNPFFTIYYSDGYEIITTWFPSFILKNNVSLSLLARGATENGISATKVREMIMSNSEELTTVVPINVFAERDSIKKYIEISKLVK